MSRRPNILLFVPDGLQGRTLAADHPCQTPNFQALADRGTTVARAYTSLPTCSPARASLMTGLLPHNHGMLTVEHTVAPDQSCLRADKPHFAQGLRDAGYRTAYFGKWHVERSLDLDHFGWTEDHSAGGALHRAASEKGVAAEAELIPELTHYLSGPDGYNDTLHFGVTPQPLHERALARTTDAACAWLADAPAEPWCICVSYFEPNEAMIASREFFDLYDAASLPLPENRHDDMLDKPAIYRRARDVFSHITDDQWRTALSCYYARISEIDHEFGRVMTALAAAGQQEDTVVLVTADHGKYVGSHGLEAHNYGAFEEIYHIPLVAAGPGIAVGQTSPGRVGLHDVCPTLLELAGLDTIGAPDSRSFAPLLRDPAAAADYQTGFAEYHGTRFTLSQRILWDGDWKYVFNGFDYDELYNLADDPHELHNLAADPSHADRCRHLMRQIWQRLDDTGDFTLHRSHYYPFRFAPVGPNG